MPISSTATPALISRPAPGRQLKRVALSLALVLALPLLWHLSPHYDASGTLVAPLQPALALALAATARSGWHALPAVVLGAAITACSWPLGAPTVPSAVEAVVLVLQAAFGGLLLRRSSRPDDLALDTDPAIRRLVAAALGSAMIGGLAELALDLAWTQQALRPGLVALVRATADGASVLLLTPVVLALAAPARLRWAARRRTVALPLAVLAAVLIGAFAVVDERDRVQAQHRFERDADVVFARAQGLLDAPLHAVQALNGALRSAAVAPSGAFFDTLAKPWLAHTAGVIQLGWIDLPREPGTTNPTAAGATVHHQLSAGASAGGPAVGETETLPAALPLRNSIARALGQEGPAVSPVVALGKGGNDSGFIVYQALPAEGGGPQRSVVFATVLADRLMTPLLVARTDQLSACLTDQDARGEQRRLYGRAGCETVAARDPASFHREAAFEFGGRHWLMHISQPVRTQGGVWLFALPALAGCSLLALLLLKVTGRAQRFETESRHRSDEMQREIAQLRQLHQRGEQALDGAFEAAQTGLALLEADGRVQRANTAFAELIGTPRDALKRRPIDELLVDDERPQQARIARLMQEAGDELAHSSMRLRLAGGRVLPALVTLRVLREPDGRAAAAVCALHDLSDNLRRRQAERVLGDVLDLAGANPPSLPPQRAARTSLQRVLCIQRNAEHAAQLRAALAERPQLQLSEAADADRGFEQVLAEAPHLILLDAELSGSDGLALLRRLTDDRRTRAIPVIVLADDPRPASIDAAFSAGARAYLTRPIEPRTLLGAIDELS